MKEMYDFCQPTIGAWLKAKLIKTRPATPVRAPGRSNLTHHLGLGPELMAGGGRLESAGTMNKLSTLISAQVIPRAQKDHCHQPSSAQREEKAEPMTIPTGPMPPLENVRQDVTVQHESIFARLTSTTWKNCASFPLGKCGRSKQGRSVSREQGPCPALLCLRRAW